MGYDSATLAAAGAVIDRRRAAAEDLQHAHRNEVYIKVPRIKQIDREIPAKFRALAADSMAGKAASKAAVRAATLELRAEKAELLAQHGYPIDYLDVKYTCKKCSDRGYVGVKMCSCLQKELSRAAGERSGLAALLGSQTFRTFKLDLYPDSARKQMERVYDYCKNYAESFSVQKSGNIFMTGPTGLGKTFLSTCIAREVMDRGFSVLYDSVANIVARFEDYKFGRGGSESELSAYNDCDLLIIDDLGTEFITQYSTSVVYTLLNNRINARRPVIVSSNLDSGRILEFYPDSIVSRLSGEFAVLTFAGSDLRVAKNRRKK